MKFYITKDLAGDQSIFLWCCNGEQPFLDETGAFFGENSDAVGLGDGSPVVVLPGECVEVGIVRA